MLSIQNRLIKREDFASVYKNGSYVSCDGISIKFIKNNRSSVRVGFPVGKNYSKMAIQRNRARRLLREATRAYLPELKPGFDIVMMIDPRKKNMEFNALAFSLQKLFIKANLLMRSNSQIKK